MSNVSHACRPVVYIVVIYSSAVFAPLSAKGPTLHLFNPHTQAHTRNSQSLSPIELRWSCDRGDPSGERKLKKKKNLLKCAINLPAITFASSSDVFCLPLRELFWLCRFKQW